MACSRRMLARRFGAAVAFACLGCAASVHPPNAPNASRAAPSEAAAQSGPASRASDAPVAATQPNSKSDDAPEESEEAEDTDEGAVDDGMEVESPPNATIRPPHPFANLSDAELEHRLTTDPASLGSMSVGKPNAGLLFNGVPMPEGAEWTVVVKGEAYGTEETIHYLTTAIHAVNAAFPATPRLAIGDISAKNGGYLSPHLSHQAGRDVDISYFYLDGEHWYVRANAENLDVKRTWAFVRALITQTDVEMLLIDHSLQLLLRAEAEREGEDREWLDSVFHGNGAVPPLIRHAPGHATHLHIRFYSPIAQETGRRLYGALVRHQLVHVGPAYVVYVARKGDTLATLAKRFHTTVPVIRRANGLRSTLIQAKRSYRIPQPGHAPPGYVQGRVAIPPRRLPPDHASAGNRNVTR